MIQESSVSKVSKMTGVHSSWDGQNFSLPDYIQSGCGTFSIQWVLEGISRVNGLHLML